MEISKEAGGQMLAEGGDRCVSGAYSGNRAGRNMAWKGRRRRKDFRGNSEAQGVGPLPQDCTPASCLQRKWRGHMEKIISREHKTSKG